MATTQDYINQLKIDKQNLVSMLNGMGVEASNNETFTSLTPKVGKIVTDPILQDKTIEITENGTTNIVADEGYDGLYNVDITVNVAGGGSSEEQPSRLPSEYQEIEYIESTGTQYINTGVNTTSNIKIEIGLPNPNLSIYNGVLYGGGVNWQNNYMQGEFDRDPTFAFKNSFYVAGIPANSDDYVLIQDSNKLYVNDNHLYSFSTSTFSTEYPIYLFTYNRGGSTGEFGSYRISYCKIYESGNLSRDFVPCYRKSDSEAGLYDLVNNQFYANSGADSFIKGENVTNSLGMQTKNITITENGTQTITADEGYDGLSVVEIVTNVATGGEIENINLFIQEDEPEEKFGTWFKTTQTTANNTYNLKYEKSVYPKWETNATSYNVKLYGHGSAFVGGDIYTFGGLNQNYTKVKEVYKYNVTTDTITSVASLPYYSHVPFVTAMGNDIYIIGGAGGSSASAGDKLNYNYKDDTLTNTYTRMADLPYSAHNIKGVTVGTDIYIFGGSLASGNTNNAYKYDTLTNSYTKLKELPYSVDGIGVTNVGDYIYLMGGATSSGRTTSAYKYNIKTNSYESVASLPVGLSNFGVLSAENYIYIFGGYVTSGNNTVLTTKSYQYDTVNNTYKEMDNLKQGVGNFGFGIVDNTIYIIGGQQSSGATNPIQKRTITPYNKNTIITKRFIEKDNDNTLTIKENKWLYQLGIEFADNIPTYYGDGTQWFNFKN